jgi:hypothetical protein
LDARQEEYGKQDADDGFAGDESRGEQGTRILGFAAARVVQTGHDARPEPLNDAASEDGGAGVEGQVHTDGDQHHRLGSAQQ